MNSPFEDDTVVHSVLKSTWVIACTFSRCRSI